MPRKPGMYLPGIPAHVVQRVGRIYVAYVNKTYRRSGTLWEGRHKASLVDGDNYLLTCYRYIELNPVVANMISAPDQYRWSSYRYHAWGETNALIKDHILYDALGSKQQTRQRCYRDLFGHQVPEVDIHQIPLNHLPAITH